MSDQNEPFTYWEKRCNVNEQVLEQLMRICIRGLPRYSSQEIVDLGNQWETALDQLDEEYDVPST